MAAEKELEIGIRATLTNAKEIQEKLKKGLEEQLVVFSEKDSNALAQRIKSLETLLSQGLFKQARKGAEELNTLLLRIFNNIHTEAGGVSSDLAELLVKVNQANKALAQYKKHETSLVFRDNAPKRGALTESQQATVQSTFNLDNSWNAATAVKRGKDELDANISDERRAQVVEALKLLGYEVVDGNLKLIEGLREAYDKQFQATLKQLEEQASAAQATYDENLNITETSKTSADGSSFDDADILNKIAESIKQLEDATKAYNKALQELREEEKKVDDEKENDIDVTKKQANATNQNTSAVGKAVTTFFGYQMVIRQLRKLWNEAIHTVTELDKQLTNQAIVTDLTREQTWKLVTTYQDLADQAGVTQTEIAAVTTEYLRQGETLENALALTKAATAAATVAGISASDSVRYLTTAIHGFKLEAEDALAVSDKFAALAAQAATNYEDLAVALSKVASQAALAGMSMDYTLALLTTGLDVTQEAPESIGTALKTVIARMREISDYGKTLEDDVDLNQVEAGLRAVGIQLRNGIGELRSTEDVLDELGRKWQDLSANQQAAVAKALAGTRQQSRLVAIMENYDDVLQNMAVSQNSLGATTAQQVKYLQGMEAAMNRLQNAYQSLIETVVKSDEIIGFVNIITNIIKQVRKFLSQPAGRWALITGVASLLLRSHTLMTKMKTVFQQILGLTKQIHQEEKGITDEKEKQAQSNSKTQQSARQRLVALKQRFKNKEFTSDDIADIAGAVAGIASAITTLVGWTQEAIETIQNRYQEAVDNAIDKASAIQSEIYNNTQTMTNLQNLSENLSKLDKQVIKSTETMSKLADTRNELLKDLGISDAEAKLYTNQQLYDKAMAKRAQLETKNNELLSQLGDTLLGAANNYDAGAGFLNILTKAGSGAMAGAMVGSSLSFLAPGIATAVGAGIGAVVGQVVGYVEEISKLIAANDARGKVHEMLQSDEGVSQLRYYFKAVYQNDIDTTTAAGERLAASVKTTYASLMDTLSGGQIEDLLNKYNWDANAMSSAVTSVLMESSEALTTLTKDTSNYADRVKAASEIYARLNEESKEFGDAFLQQYGSYVQLGAILGENVQYMDDFKWSMTAMNELLSQLADDGKTIEEMADIVKTLGEAMKDNTLSAEELEAALGNMSHAAREAAAELISSFTMQDIADQFTTAKNSVNTIRETQSKWGSMTATERQRFIDDNEDFFNIPGAREAFYNGEDITDYIEEYKKSIQDDLIKTVTNKIEALQVELYDLEKQYAEAKEAGDAAQMELLDKQIKTTQRSLEDLKDTYADVNSMFNLTLSEVVSKQNEQISKLKEMYQAEEKALTDSLNKRKEAYQKYFDGLAKAESLEEYNQSREDLVNAIAKVGAGTDATSRRKVADLQRQLQELDKQEAQRQKEEARQAVLENIDNEISRIQEQFDKLLQSDQALLDSMNENTYFQYLAYLAQSGQTKEAQELAVQQMGDLLKRKWGVSGNQLFGNVATETTSPSISDVQVDTASNNFTVVNSAGVEQQVQLTEAQMRQLVAQLLDTVKRWTGLSYGN